MHDPEIIPVCCALIEHKGKVLIAQRNSRVSNANHWEFPGGKQEKSETAEECLIREIREELSITIVINGKLEPVIHHYPDKSIALIPFICNYSGGKVNPEEHKKILWVDPKEFPEFKWSGADIKIWEQYLEKVNKKTGIE